MTDAELVAKALPLYEVQGELGRGAWGVVLAARHRQLARDVAIKQLPPSFGADPAVRSRFVAEARLLASFENPHIVPIYDFIEHEGLCLLVMERLTGGTVWSRCQAGGFPPGTSCALILAACAAMHYAHQRGVLHRDIKPENLMFSSNNVLKVTDFGIAKVVGGAATVATRAGDILGTPAYMAPEQAQGGELSPATDIYAAGTVLYQLLAGRLPFPEDTNPVAMLYRHVHEEPRPLDEAAPHVPRALAEVTAKALAKDPADRYPDAEQFAIAIADAAASAWGAGWLPATGATVTASGPVLSAALGHRPAAGETLAPGALAAVEHPASSELSTADLVPLSALVEDAAPRPPAPRGPASPGSPSVATPQAGAPAPAGSPPPGHPSASAGASPPGEAPTMTPRDLETMGPSRSATSEGAPRRRVPTGLVAAGVVAVAVAAMVVALVHQHRHRAAVLTAATAGMVPTEWKPGHDAPTARQQLGTVAVGDSVWVLGGLTDEQTSTAKVERYTPSSDSWSKGPDLPLPLHHEMAVAYKGEVVVLGGWVPANGSLTATTSDRVFALRGGHWAELPRLPHGRAAGAAAVADGRIVVFGGQAGGQLVSATDVFDGTHWTSGPDLPTPRDHVAAASDGTSVYAVGGRLLSSDKNLDALERYDPVAQRWDQLAPMPTPRGDLAAAIIAGKLFALGGETPTSVLGTVESYDLQSLKWSGAPSLPTPRHGLGVAAAGSSLYAIDGALRPGHTASASTVEALGFAANGTARQWQTIHESPTPRAEVATAVDDGNVWVMGGATADGLTAKVEGYDPAIDTWKSGPDLPVPVRGAMATTYKGDIVVLGGWVPAPPQQSSGYGYGGSGAPSRTTIFSNRVFALRQGKWVELPQLRDARAAGAAVVIGDRLIVVGGVNDNGLVATTEVYDGTAWTLGTDMPTPRDHLAAATDGHYLFAVGGHAGSADRPLATVERYDPDARVWQGMPDMPTPRGGLGAAFVSGKVVAVGGDSPSSALGAVEAFDVRGNAWSPLPPLGAPRHDAAVAALGQSLFAIDGGLDPGSGHPTPAGEVLRF